MISSIKGFIKSALFDPDSGNTASIVTLTDDDTNIDGESGLVAASENFFRINSTTVKPARMDASTHSIRTMGYEHSEIHGGSHYFLDDVSTLAINNVFDVQWTTQNTTKWDHFTFSLSCESETEWYVYEGATINVAGTAMPPFNNNRNSLNTAGSTVSYIENTSLANANADTDVSGATQLAHGIIGSGRSGGFDSRDREIVLKQNTIYAFRAIANAAGYINFIVEYYEHTDKD